MKLPNDKAQVTLHGAAAWIITTFGLLAWLWVGEWRWAVTGLAAGMIVGLAGAAYEAHIKRKAVAAMTKTAMGSIQSMIDSFTSGKPGDPKAGDIAGLGELAELLQPPRPNQAGRTS